MLAQSRAATPRWRSRGSGSESQRRRCRSRTITCLGRALRFHHKLVVERVERHRAVVERHRAVVGRRLMQPRDPQGAGYAAAQRLAQQQGSPWDPQGAGYAASQRLAQRAPVQGPLAALGQQPNSPFTMVLRPNAPAESGGRGQGGSPLSTALDLSGYQPPPPQAPPSYNLGYGGGGTWRISASVSAALHFPSTGAGAL